MCYFDEDILKYTIFDNCIMNKFNILKSNMNFGGIINSKLKYIVFENNDFTEVSFFNTMLADIDFTSCIIDNIKVSENLKELKNGIFSVIQSVELAKLIGIIIK